MSSQNLPLCLVTTPKSLLGILSDDIEMISDASRCPLPVVAAYRSLKIAQLDSAQLASVHFAIAK